MALKNSFLDLLGHQSLVSVMSVINIQIKSKWWFQPMFFSNMLVRSDRFPKDLRFRHLKEATPKSSHLVGQLPSHLQPSPDHFPNPLPSPQKAEKRRKIQRMRRCYQLIVTCKRMQQKNSAPTCDFELHRSGILMLQMMWEWYDCEPVALPLNMVFLLKAYYQAVGVFFAEPVSSAMRSTLSKLATMSLDGCHRTKQSSLASPVMSFRDSWLIVAAHQLSLACYGMFYFRERGRLH